MKMDLIQKNYHSVIVKSPHCEPEFYDDWANKNLNVDAIGATSANLLSLGHKNCQATNISIRGRHYFYSRS